MRFWAIISLFLVVSCASKNETLKIAVAANLGAGVDSLANYFEEIEKVDCEVILGSSGELATQIENGAPFDIYIAADKAYADRLFEQNLCNEPVMFLSSELVCINHIETDDATAEELLLNEKIQTIGIADPEVAPFGKAAKSYLESKGIWKQVEDKIVYGESVSHLNNMIETYSIDAALTSFSFLEQMDFAYPFYNIENTSETEINQYLVQIDRGEDTHPKAEKFASFLVSEDAYRILAYFGY